MSLLAVRRHTARRIFTAFLLGASISLLALQAAATSVVVADFGGRKTSVMRAKIEAALTRAGHTVTLQEAGQEITSSSARQLAASTGAAAVVAGTISRLGQESWLAVLQVRSGSTGQLVGEEIRFDDRWLPGLTRQLIDKSGKALKPLLEQAESESRSSRSLKKGVSSSVAPAAAASIAGPLPQAANEEPWEDSGAESISSVPEDGALFRLLVRAGAVRRSLEFSDDIYGRLRTHSVNMGVYQVEGIVYPFTRPVGERLGLIASYEAGVSGVVIDTDFNREFAAKFQEFFFGLRARYPVDAHEVGFDLTYGQMKSGLEDSTGLANVPDTSYSVVRTSLHGALNFGGLTSLVSAGFRLPLGYGQMSEDTWFPRVSGYGVEASAGLSYPITDRLVVEATGSLRRYVLEMNSEPEDAQGVGAEVAGGAIDLYLGGYLGLSYRL